MRHTIPTEQELFNKVALHLLRQKAKALRDDESGICTMRDNLGRRCAVGCLVNPEKFEPWMNLCGSARMLSIQLKNHGRQSVLTETLDAHYHFLSMLQKIHDDRDADGWHSALSDLALNRNLKMPRLQSSGIA